MILLPTRKKQSSILESHIESLVAYLFHKYYFQTLLHRDSSMFDFKIGGLLLIDSITERFHAGMKIL